MESGESLGTKNTITEETLQSIEGTLKRIEEILAKNHAIDIEFVPEDSNGKRFGNKEKCKNVN